MYPYSRRERKPLADLDGVFYKRMGNTTQKVTGEELHSWLLSNLKTSWADLPAEDIEMEELSQDAIDFFIKNGSASKRMSSKAAESDRGSLLRNYRLMDKKGLRNSAVILFLDEPAKVFTSASVNMGEYSDDGRLLRLDCIDCPAVMQPGRVMDLLLNKYIKGVDDIEGLMRVTKYPYPDKALREAVMNCICHRDYSGMRQTYIRIYPDRIEISNPGRLPDGWTEKDLFEKHDSVLTNPAIANVFFEMGYIEKFGSGIEMIRKECAAAGTSAEYKAERERVEIIFRHSVKGAAASDDAAAELFVMTETESKIYALILAGKGSKIADMSEDSGISSRTVSRILKKLVDNGYIQRIGEDRSGKWVPVIKV